MGKDHAGPSSRPSSSPKAQLPTLVVHFATQSTGKAPPEDPSYCGPGKITVSDYVPCTQDPKQPPKLSTTFMALLGLVSFLCGCHWA